MSDRRTLPESPYLAAATGRKPNRVPVWFMRQAGRSLPEYRELRRQNTMMEACFNAELIAEITLQPIRRHDVDAAILFSDIVVPLRGAGRRRGHRRRCRTGHRGAGAHRRRRRRPAGRSIRAACNRFRTRSHCWSRELGQVPLIGFAGAPFTLASYLVEGGPSRNHAKTKAMMLSEPDCWHALMDKLTDLTVGFLRVQLDAGVDAIQVFDSWAGVLSLADYRRYVLPHSSRVFAELADRGVPMTHFGVGTAELLGAMSSAGATVVGVDWRTSLVDAAARVESGKALQGNLDPAVLLAGWPTLERVARTRGRRRAARRGRRRGRAHLQPRPRRAARDRPRDSHRPGSADPLLMTSAKRSYCVVGGGISGLTAAYRLRQAAGDQASVTLFEPSDRLGGVLRTEQVGGVAVDVGAEAFVVRRPEMPALLAELGLANEQLGTTGARPLIYSQARLHPLPTGTLNGIPSSAESMAGLVNDATLARIAAEPDRAVEMDGPAPTRPSPSCSSTGSASRWWPGRWTRCSAGSTRDRRRPSVCVRPPRRWRPVWMPAPRA